MGFAFASGPQDKKQGVDWKQVARKALLNSLGPDGVPSKCPLPLLSGLGLGSSASAMGSSLLLACLLWGAQGQKSPAGDLAQNVLKAFPQIAGFNLNKSFLVAFRTLAEGEGQIMS